MRATLTAAAKELYPEEKYKGTGSYTRGEDPFFTEAVESPYSCPMITVNLGLSRNE